MVCSGAGSIVVLGPGKTMPGPRMTIVPGAAGTMAPIRLPRVRGPGTMVPSGTGTTMTLVPCVMVGSGSGTRAGSSSSSSSGCNTRGGTSAPRGPGTISPSGAGSHGVPLGPGTCAPCAHGTMITPGPGTIEPLAVALRRLQLKHTTFSSPVRLSSRSTSALFSTACSLSTLPDRRFKALGSSPICSSQETSSSKAKGASPAPGSASSRAFLNLPFSLKAKALPSPAMAPEAMRSKSLTNSYRSTVPFLSSSARTNAAVKSLSDGIGAPLAFSASISLTRAIKATLLRSSSGFSALFFAENLACRHVAERGSLDLSPMGTSSREDPFMTSSPLGARPPGLSMPPGDAAKSTESCWPPDTARVPRRVLPPPTPLGVAAPLPGFKVELFR
mmetsp:Transcript_23841/g.53791  ORF Transcript_23841/g.53791 Transcript_23841/m.53791 type:complete len:388 (-) Transcript_23841:761-1924(-)